MSVSETLNLSDYLILTMKIFLAPKGEYIAINTQTTLTALFWLLRSLIDWPENQN